MPNIIGIIAPVSDPKMNNINLEFNPKINQDELSIRLLFNLCKNSYDLYKIPAQRLITLQETVPSAGYYLEGLLHSHGYDTMLLSDTEKESLEQLQKKGAAVAAFQRP